MIGITVPQKRQVVTPGTQGETKGRNIGAIVGTVAGAIAAPYTGGASVALGSTMGGYAGSLTDKQGTDAVARDAPGEGGGPVVNQDSAVKRQLASMKGDHVTTLGEGLASLARTNDPNLTKEALPPLYQAYTKAYDQQFGPRRG